jgi:hypothetical protein
MRWLSLFLACQHLNSGTNVRECEDQSWFKVQAVPVFVLIDVRCVSVPPKMTLHTSGWRETVFRQSSTLYHRHNETILFIADHIVWLTAQCRNSSPGRSKIVHVLQTGSGAQPASYTMVIGEGVGFQGGKAAGAWIKCLLLFDGYCRVIVGLILVNSEVEVVQSASLSWCRAPIWSPWSDFCFLSENCGFLYVGCPLWREDGSGIYSYRSNHSRVQVPQN